METLDKAELCFPQLLNTSCVKTKRRHFESLLTNTLLFSVSQLTVILNLLVIVSISHFKQLQTPTNLLLLSLAVSDFFVGFLMLFHIMVIDGCWFLGDLMCSLYQYLAYIITIASVETTVLISVDRYVAVCYPLHYSNKVTQKKVKICVGLCWICSIVVPGLYLKDDLTQPGRFNSCFGECIIVLNYIAGIVDFFCSFIVPITVIVVLYMRVFVVAVTQARAMRSHIATVTRSSGKVTVKKSELKAARTLGVVVIVFLMCICPYYCVSLVGEDALLNALSTAYIVCLFYVNSCLNPLIYVFFYPWFRKSVRFIVTLKILQPGSREANLERH